MVNHQKYEEVIQSLLEILAHYDTEECKNIHEKILNANHDFDIKLLVIGHFNAGKSSLLNTLIDRPELLKVSQNRETALATELRYADKECARAITVNQECEQLKRGKQYSADAYSHLEYDIPSENLKAISDFTVVDTPGFDSGVEAHVKALSGYIGKGSAYLVVIDQNKGEIDQSTMNAIQEASEYSNRIAILFNKCDKISKATQDEILTKARNTLSFYGLPYKVYAVSRDFPNMGQKLVEIISEFNAQDAYDEIMEERLGTEIASLQNVLRLTQKKICLDTYNIDEEIRHLKNLSLNISEAMQKQKEKILNDLPEKIETLIGEIRSQLETRSSDVADALLNKDKEGVEAIIVEAVRPVMMSELQEFNTENLNKIAASLDIALPEDSQDRSILMNEVLNLASDMKNLISNGSFEADYLDDKEQSDKNAKLYRSIISAAALLTDFVSPWAEILLVMLPDIRNMLSNIFSESHHDKAEHQYKISMIPQICNNLYPIIQKSMTKNANTLIAAFQDKLNAKIELIQDNLDKANELKKTQITEYEAYKETLKNDVDALKILESKV